MAAELSSDATSMLIALSELGRMGSGQPIPTPQLAVYSGLNEADCWRGCKELEEVGLAAVYDPSTSPHLPRSAAITRAGQEATRGLGVVTGKGRLTEFAAALGEIELKAVDAVTEAQLAIPGNSASRSQVRMAVRNAITPKPTIEAVNAALERLTMSYLRFMGGPEPSYQVTLRGLLSSSWGQNVLQIIGSTIELLRNEKTSNPSMFRYSWHSIQRACQLPPEGETIAHVALTSAGLGAGWFRNEDGPWLQNPPELDVIFEHLSGLEYVRSLLPPLGSVDERVIEGDVTRNGSVAAMQPETKKAAATKIFVSHASVDTDLAKGLINLIEAGIETRTGDIRCTSVPGYKLEAGDRAPDVLRQNLEACTVVVGILTKQSVSSPYVLMELGAAWAFGKRAILLVGPGATIGDLPGPFREVHALHMADESDMAGLDKTIATATGLPETGNPAKVHDALKALSALVSASGSTASEASARPSSGDEPARASDSEPVPPATQHLPPTAQERTAPSDSDIVMMLTLFLENCAVHEVHDKPMRFDMIDSGAGVPSGSAKRLIAKALGAKWREDNRSDSFVTLKSQPARVVSVRSKPPRGW